ncbi:ABC transporter ATP-binding protein [Isoptericola croceus]|uniref:ABC transporter ATP-binding protein n=1 Tax=Isoptericola croceus TaxID=3031406 RepID=UPI0023F6465C|nr:ABC transporter ATP-binding protein [Isoptericola croceus]
MSTLTITGLHKSFGTTEVLRGVDLRVTQGSLTAVLGPSGCGKTTLLRTVAGFERPDAGQVRLGHVEVVGPRTWLPAEKRRVGVVPQEGTLFPHLDVAQNVGFGLPRRSPGRRERVQRVLDVVGLADLADRRPHELSGGQQQRVALARALAPEPEVVLLDEPFSALDAGLRAAVREDVRAALHEVGATALLVTHDQEEALSIADEVAVMRAGRVVQHGTPQTVYLRPADLDVARFVGEAVVLDARANGANRVSTLLGPLHVLGPSPGVGAGVGRVVLRPEQILIVPPGEGTPAIVERTVFHGHDSTVHLTVHPAGTRRGSPASAPIICRVQGSVPEHTEVAVRVDGPVVWYP